MHTTCEICGKPTGQKFLKTLKVNLYICPFCGIIRKDPSSYLSLQEEKARYDLHTNSPDDPGYVKYLDSFLETAVLPFISSKGRALDFGSGPGPVLAQLLQDKYGFEVSIYDPYYAPDEASLNRVYDLITSTEVFEHLSQPGPSFVMLAGILRDGGILAIKTEFVDGQDLEDWYYIKDPTHICFFTLRSFEILAEENELNIIYTDNKSIISFKK